jgi:ankyrin repeat protein
MRIRLKFIVYLLLALGIFSAHAGSYEDFFVAVKRDDPATLGQLLQRGFDPNTVSPDGMTGLFIALREGALKSATLLAGWRTTKAETRTAQDESPLMMAALRGHLEIAKTLIARDADVNKTGWTPLHYAATGGHLEMIALLLDNSAYIDAESPNGTTPLMMAAQYGSPAAVKLLLEAGADVTLRNQLGLSALDFARRGQRPDSIELLAGFARTAKPRGTW